jgi:hypothetical protein
MVELKDIKEKELLVFYANEFEELNILKVIESGVSSEAEAENLARFYWKIVDESIEKKDLEHILERIYTALHIHCGNNGYSDVWRREIP